MSEMEVLLRFPIGTKVGLTSYPDQKLVGVVVGYKTFADMTNVEVSALRGEDISYILSPSTLFAENDAP